MTFLLPATLLPTYLHLAGLFTLEYHQHERCAQLCRIAMMKTFQVNVNGDVQSVKDIKKIGVRIQPIFQTLR
jgi:hypothetical protein